MANIWLLIKISLKTIISNYLTKTGLARKRRFNWRSFGLISIAVALLISILYGIVLGYLLSRELQEGIIVIMFFIPILSFMVVVSSLLSVMTLLFFSSDTSLFLPLPIKPGQILIARLISCYVLIQLFMAVLIYPWIIGFLLGSFITFTAVLYIIIILLLLPIFPLVIISILSFLLAAILPRKRMKIGAILGMIFLTVFVPALFFLINSTYLVDESMVSILDIAIRINQLFPFTFFASWALYQHQSMEGLIAIVIFVLTSAVATYLTFVIANKLYGRIIKSNNDVHTKKRRGKMKHYSVRASITKKYMAHDFKQIGRNYYLFLSLFIAPLFLPICFAVSFLGDMNSTLDFSSLSIYNGTFLLTVIGFIIINMMLPTIALTSFSRERTSALTLKYLPISKNKVLTAKLMLSFLVNLFIALLYFVVIALIVKPIQQEAIIFFVYTITICLLINLLFSFIGIMLDLWRPNLHWQSERELIKNNIKVGIIAIINLVVGMTLIFFSMYGLKVILNIHIVAISSIAILTIANICLANYLYKLSSIKFYKNIC